MRGVDFRVRGVDFRVRGVDFRVRSLLKNWPPKYDLIGLIVFTARSYPPLHLDNLEPI